MVLSAALPCTTVTALTLGPGPCSLRAGLAAQGGGHNLRGEVQEVSQVLDTFIGEVPVKMAPRKLLLHIPTRLQGLQRQACTQTCIFHIIQTTTKEQGQASS